MLASILLTAALSLGVSPAAYDNALANQAYQVTVISHSSQPMDVHTELSPDASCSIDLSKTVSWATLSGPSSFVLAPHAERKFVVSVGQPPPGQSELIAAFIATDPGKGGVHTSAGVGTALRFSEPGKTVVAPCPKPRPATNPNIRTVTLGQASSATGALEIALGVVVALFILAIIAAFLYTRRSRRSTR